MGICKRQNAGPVFAVERLARRIRTLEAVI